MFKSFKTQTTMNHLKLYHSINSQRTLDPSHQIYNFKFWNISSWGQGGTNQQLSFDASPSFSLTVHTTNLLFTVQTNTHTYTTLDGLAKKHWDKFLLGFGQIQMKVTINLHAASAKLNFSWLLTHITMGISPDEEDKKIKITMMKNPHEDGAKAHIDRDEAI